MMAYVHLLVPVPLRGAGEALALAQGMSVPLCPNRGTTDRPASCRCEVRRVPASGHLGSMINLLLETAVGMAATVAASTVWGTHPQLSRAWHPPPCHRTGHLSPQAHSVSIVYVLPTGRP